MTENVDILIRNATEGVDALRENARELRGLGGDTEQVDAAVEALSAELKELSTQQQLIGQFRQLRGQLGDTQTALAAAKAEAQRLGKEFGEAERPSATLRREFDKARKTVRELTERQQRQRKSLQDLRGSLRDVGVATTDLNGAQSRVQASLQATRDKAKRLDDSLASSARSLRETQQANKALRADFDKLGVRPFNEVQKEVEETRAALDRLRKSGQLSGRELAKAQQAAEVKVRDLQRSTNGLSDALGRSRIALGAAAAGFVGFIASAGNAVGSARELERSLAEIKTLLNDPDQLAPITKAVKEFAAQYGTKQREQAAAYYQTISAGFTSVADSAEVVDAANKLAVGGVTDTRTAVDGLTSVLNAYNLQADQSTRISDIFFSAVKNGKTTVDEMAGAVGRVTPLAAQLGVGFEGVAASIATLTAGGLETSEAVTQLRGILSSIIKPTDDARKAAAELGVQFDTDALRAKGLAGFLQDVTTAAGGNEEVLGRLFGQVDALGGVLGLTGDQAKRFAGNLLAARDSAGATEEAFNKVNETGDRVFARLAAQFDIAKTTVGNFISSALIPLATAATGVLEAFNALPDGVQGLVAVSALLLPTVVGLSAAFSALRGALLLVRGAAQGVSFKSLITGVDAAGGSLTRTTAATGLLARAIGGLVTVLKGVGAVGLIVTTLAPLARFAGEYAASFSEAARNAKKAAAEQAALFEQEIQALKEREASLERYANVRVRDAGLVAELSEADRQRYAEQLAGARELIKVQIGLAVRERELAELRGENTSAIDGQLRELNQRNQELRDTQAALKGEVEATAQAHERAAETATAATEATADRVEQALKAVREAAGESKKETVDLLTAISEAQAEVNKQLDEAKGRTKNLTEAYSGLQTTVDGTKDDLARRLSENAKEVDDLSAALVELRDRTLKQLGIDAQEVLTGIDQNFSKVLQAVDLLGQNSTTAAAQMRAAFEAAFDQANSIEELRALEDSLQRSSVAGFSLAKAKKEIADKAAELKQRTKEVADAEREVEGAAQSRAETQGAANRDLAEGAKEGRDQLNLLRDTLAQINGAQTFEDLAAAAREAREAFQSGAIDAQDYEAALLAVEAQTQSLREANKQLAADLINGFLAANEQFAAGFGDAVAAEYRRIAFGVESAAQATGSHAEHLAQVQRQLVALPRVTDPFLAFLNSTTRASLQAAEAHLRQAAEADRLVEALQSSGGATEATIRSAERALRQFDLLDSQQLQGLRGAIAGARDELARLNDQAGATVASLRDELDQLQGNFADVEKRRAAAQRGELQAQLSRADALGDREAAAELREALRLLAEVERIRVQEARERGQSASGAANPSPAPASAPPSEVAVTLRTASGPIRGVFSPDAADALIRMLNDAGLTATSGA